VVGAAIDGHDRTHRAIGRGKLPLLFAGQRREPYSAHAGTGCARCRLADHGARSGRRRAYLRQLARRTGVFASIAMRPLLDATFAGQSEHSIRFDLESGWRCHLFVLADDLVRVLFLRDDTVREPRSWMVAPGGIDVPWEGRDRRDVSAFPCPPPSIVEDA